MRLTSKLFSADRKRALKRICIISPGQLGCNPRVVKEAESLSKHGYSVHVIATKVTDFVEQRDQSVLAQAKYSVNRVSFDVVWRRRVARARQEFARKLSRFAPSVQLSAEAHSAMTPRLIKAALATQADLYIAHYIAALPAAAAAARRHGAIYAFDAEDFHLGDLPEAPEYVLDKSLIHDIEERYLPDASYVTAASPLIAQAYSHTYGILAPSTILNAFPRANAPPGPTPRGTASPGPSVYWFSQTIGPGRGLELAIQAIARSKSRPHLYLRGTPARGYKAHLQALAGTLSIEDRLHILEPALPADLERLGAIYDLGFVGELSLTRSRAIALTNKLFSYLTSGLPILASDIPSHRAIAEGSQAYLKLFRDEQTLADCFDNWLCSSDRLAAARSAAFAAGQSEYAWEKQEATLLSVVAEAFARADRKTVSAEQVR